MQGWVKFYPSLEVIKDCTMIWDVNTMSFNLKRSELCSVVVSPPFFCIICSVFQWTLQGLSELNLQPFFFLLSWSLWDQSSFLGFCWNQSLIALQQCLSDTSFSRLQKKLCPLCASLLTLNSSVSFSAFLEPSQMKRGIELDVYLISNVFYILSTGVVVPDNCKIPWAIL